LEVSPPAGGKGTNSHSGEKIIAFLLPQNWKLTKKFWHAGKWHTNRVLMTGLWIALVVLETTYFVFRGKYTLATATDPRDSSSNAKFKNSPYADVALCIEILAAIAMSYSSESPISRCSKYCCLPPDSTPGTAGSMPKHVRFCLPRNLCSGLSRCNLKISSVVRDLIFSSQARGRDTSAAISAWLGSCSVPDACIAEA